MSENLVNVDLGKETELDIKLDGGKLVMSLVYTGSGGSATVALGVAPDYFLDKLAALIPGTLDDKLLDLLKLALK